MSDFSLDPSCNVLVTGVTGLIGGEIVRRLAHVGVGKIWVLVRPQGDARPQERFLQRMHRSGDTAEAMAWSGVEALTGDVTRPNWDLSAEDYGRITRSVDLIIHCAADTSFLCKQGVRDTNVLGAEHLIALARACRRRPLVVYVSTATNGGKLSHCCLREDEGCRPENEHHNEYTRSKAVAERMVRESGLHTLTLRPTIVLSAGLPDQAFAQSILWFVPLLRHLPRLPVDAQSHLDVVPVSFVADATVALLQRPHRRYDCYHLSAGAQHSLTTDQVNRYLNRFYKRMPPLELVSPPSWNLAQYRASVRTKRQRRIFFGLRFYLPFLNMDVTYDNRRLREELGELPVPPLTQYLGGLLKQISQRRAMQEAARP